MLALNVTSQVAYAAYVAQPEEMLHMADNKIKNTKISWQFVKS